jgi:undecaprenyl diphosphate synthase
MKYPSAEEHGLDPAKIPHHIGIIMDGNRRWATRHNLPKHEGHREGVKRVKPVLEQARDIGVYGLTLYTFSTENWARSEVEIETIFDVFQETILNEMPELHANGIRVRFPGFSAALPPLARELIEEAEDLTRDNKKQALNILMNYGGRQDILHGVKRAHELMTAGKLSPEDLTEETFSELLLLHPLKDPDLIIRTSGEQRLSNFLIWQAAYSEFLFTETLWPDFHPQQLVDCVREYQKRDQRYGQ